MQDRFEREISVGDDIVYCTRRGSLMKQRQGKVLQVKDNRIYIKRYLDNWELKWLNGKEPTGRQAAVWLTIPAYIVLLKPLEI